MVYEFNDCVLDTGRYVLERGGEAVRLEPQVFDVLAHLLRNRGRVVTKEELFDEVWGTRYVGEASLTSRMRAARQAVGDSGSKQAVIRTVRNRGYELIAEVVERADAAAPERPLERAPAAPARPTSVIPAAVHALIGRDELLVELREELDENRLVTLIGPGGVGKTTVAYELARSLEPRYADGVCAVELVAIDDGNAAVQALATALDVQPARDTSLEDAVVNVLRPRQTLLLLDNCEHLVEALAAVADRLLQTAPRVSIVATSRQPLAVRGERLWPVEPLAIDSAETLEGGTSPAVALFAERAAAVDPRFTLEESTIDSVVNICRRLDGMPLAIELAAARVRSLGVREIEARLDERFRLLRSVRRSGDRRHQALHDTVRWSYDLLSEEEQTLFNELSVFAGPFDITAAAAVSGDLDELDTLELLTGLVERSMLSARRSAAGEACYELLETLRAFGRSTLEVGARARVGARHAAHYAQVAREVEIAQQGASEPAASARAESAFVDLRVAQRFALEHGDIDQALTLIGSVREYGMRAMRYEALGWAEAALAAEGVAGHPLAATVRGTAAYAVWIRGEFERALSLANGVEEDESASSEALGLAKRVQANVYYVLGQVERGLDAGRVLLELAEESGQPSRIAHAAYMLSVALSSTDETAEASALAARAQRLGEETACPTDLASAWAAHGFAAHGDTENALAAFARSAEIASAAGNRWMAAFAATEISALRLLCGEVDDAAHGLAGAVDTWYRAGEWSQQWQTLARCLPALTALGHHALAARVAGAVERRAALGTPPNMAPLRDRTLAVAEELARSLGEERYRELHAEGGDLPITDVVHTTRTALLGEMTG